VPARLHDGHDLTRKHLGPTVQKGAYALKHAARSVREEAIRAETELTRLMLDLLGPQGRPLRLTAEECALRLWCVDLVDRASPSGWTAMASLGILTWLTSIRYDAC